MEELGEAKGYTVNRHTQGEASRNQLFRASDSGHLRDSRYLHFATHGHLAPQDARLSGLVLSVVDEKGKSHGGDIEVHVRDRRREGGVTVREIFYSPVREPETSLAVAASKMSRVLARS